MGTHPLCLMLPLAHDRELCISPEFPGYRLALRRRDGDSLRYEGGFRLSASEIAELRTVLATITSDTT